MTGVMLAVMGFVAAAGAGYSIGAAGNTAEASAIVYIEAADVSQGSHTQRQLANATRQLKEAQDAARQLASLGVSEEGRSSATGGTLFSMEKIRTYEGERIAPDRRPKELYETPAEADMCERWAVLTSIFEPTDAVRELAAAEGWCVVVVGDKNGKTYGARYEPRCKSYGIWSVVHARLTLPLFRGADLGGSSQAFLTLGSATD